MKLEKVLKYKKGKSPQKGQSDENLILYLTPEYLRGNSSPNYIPDFPIKVEVNDGDLLLLWDGSNAGEFFKGKKGILSSTMVKFDYDKLEYNSDFLFYQLKAFEGYLKAQTNGSGIPHVDKEILLGLEIEDFKKTEQTRIAEILSTADEAITHTEALIAKYQRIKTGLMQDLLTRGIDENGNIRSKETHKFVVKNGIEVPEEWEVDSIGDIVEQIGSGITPKGGSNVYIHSGVMLIRSQNVLKGEFDFSDVAFISDEINSQMKRSQLKELDVLLNITGASIGRSHFLPFGFPKANVNQHVCIIRLCEKSLGKSLFLSTYLNDFKGQNQIKRLLGSSNREGLNFQQIREIKVGMPKIEFDDEFERIRKVFESQNDSIDVLKLNLSKFQSLKTGLMQDLLSGKVRVKI